MAEVFSTFIYNPLTEGNTFGQCHWSLVRSEGDLT